MKEGPTWNQVAGRRLAGGGGSEATCVVAGQWRVNAETFLNPVTAKHDDLTSRLRWAAWLHARVRYVAYILWSKQKSRRQCVSEGRRGEMISLEEESSGNYHRVMSSLHQYTYDILTYGCFGSQLRQYNSARGSWRMSSRSRQVTPRSVMDL